MMRMPPSPTPPSRGGTPTPNFAFSGLRASSVGAEHRSGLLRRQSSLPPEGVPQASSRRPKVRPNSFVESPSSTPTSPGDDLRFPPLPPGLPPTSPPPPASCVSSSSDPCHCVSPATITMPPPPKPKLSAPSSAAPPASPAQLHRPVTGRTLGSHPSTSPPPDSHPPEEMSNTHNQMNISREQPDMDAPSVSLAEETFVRQRTNVSSSLTTVSTSSSTVPDVEYPEKILLTIPTPGEAALMRGSSASDSPSPSVSRKEFFNASVSRSLSCSSSSIEMASLEKMTSSTTILESVRSSTVTEVSSTSSSDQIVSESTSSASQKTVFEKALMSQLSFTEQVESLSSTMVSSVSSLKEGSLLQQSEALQEMQQAVKTARLNTSHGMDMKDAAGDALRESGGLELLVSKFEDSPEEIKMGSATLLGDMLTAKNRDHVVAFGLDASIMRFSMEKGDVGVARVGTGLLGQLFKHSEDSCLRVIRSGGLDAIVTRCGSNDAETQRACAVAFANLAMYGGLDSQQKMIQHDVPEWLFPLAFSLDPMTKYYACLAVCALVSNKEIEAAVRKSGTLNLVDPFIATHDPSEFALADDLHLHGQSSQWLRRLIPVLESTNSEAQKLASFHFAMEAFIKSRNDKLSILKDIGAIEALKRVASCPNDVASKLARTALKILQEDIPHRLSQQVPLWGCHDVYYWVKHVLDFPEYAQHFRDCIVDGDLLLQITDDILKTDIHMTNGLHRKLFLRQLTLLKQQCDYSACDYGRVFSWLAQFAVPLTHYTYDFILNSVSRYDLALLNDADLREDLGISNSIHRKMILQAIEAQENPAPAVHGGQIGDNNAFGKNIDAFISYRRSNGSQLASLLKVHLQLRSYQVFIDVETLAEGKFDENLLLSVRAAKNFILILSPNALDRCMGDEEQNDWVHKEIVTALQSGCNIIPITDNFMWPQPEVLPMDIRKICRYNGIKWIHDYQDACVAKIVRFIKGETVVSAVPSVAGGSSVAASELGI